MDNDITIIETENSINRAEVAFSLEQHIKDLKIQLGHNFLNIGKTLKEIRDNEYYRELGYESISEWLNSPDISISARWAWDFIAIYEVFILEHKVDPQMVLETDYSKLHQILPLVRNETENSKVEAWLEKAKNLRRIDLTREINEYRHVDDQQIADAGVAHIRVSLLLDWINLIKQDQKDTVIEEITGEIKKSTGLLDLSKIKGPRV